MNIKIKIFSSSPRRAQDYDMDNVRVSNKTLEEEWKDDDDDGCKEKKKGGRKERAKLK